MPETKIKFETVTRRGEVEVQMRILVLPRGGGNRQFSRRLGNELKRHPVFAPHITKLVIGCSSVCVYLRPSLKLSLDLAATAISKAARTGDVAGQLPLFSPG
jgi:hypothetical protein